MPLIEEYDKQYSRLLWEFESKETAVFIDQSALRISTPKKKNSFTGQDEMILDERSKRLYRALNLMRGDDSEMFEVFSPDIRDINIINGLNQLAMRIEDVCGLSHGTLSDVNVQAKTATELKVGRQWSYVTVADNQRALEGCLRDVIRAMDKYASFYSLAPEGEYDVSFEWDDSIVTDSEQQLNERLMLVNAGIMSKSEFRAWYFGETQAQAAAAIEALAEEQRAYLETSTPDLGADDDEGEE